MKNLVVLNIKKSIKYDHNILGNKDSLMPRKIFDHFKFLKNFEKFKKIKSLQKKIDHIQNIKNQDFQKFPTFKFFLKFSKKQFISKFLHNHFFII